MSRYNKLYFLIEKKRTELQSLSVKEPVAKTPKKFINAESEDRHFSFYEIKKQLVTCESDDEKILLLTKEMFEYQQASIEFINQKTPMYDVQCAKEIEHIYALQKLQAAVEQNKREQNQNQLNNVQTYKYNDKNERFERIFVSNEPEAFYSLSECPRGLGGTSIKASDFNNDGVNEIMLFSSGFDKNPFPGDSLAFFDTQNKKYSYLTDDIGYFHGGATGDIDLDGNQDIIAYSGGSAVIPVHPVSYKNNGSLSFNLNNEIFKNFTDSDNYYTVELFDINKDGNLDLFLGSSKILRVIPSANGIFDRAKAINFQVDSNLELMDIAFLDFDFDGKIDVLTMSNKEGYNGYGLRLYLNKDNGFIESTKNYFDVTDEIGKGAWIKWIRLFDFDQDGDIDVVADGLFGVLEGNKGRKIYWRNDAGKFKQINLYQLYN